MRYKKFILVLIVFSMCGMYSLGVFDAFFSKNVSDKYYETGGFFYTGNISNGKFHNEGIIKLDDGSELNGMLKNGDLCGDFTFLDKGYCINGTFQKDNIIKADLKTDKYKALIRDNDTVDYENNNGWYYTGQFNIFGQNNIGTFTYKDKSKYIGAFSKGLADKEGVFYSKEGKINYKGNVKNGFFHGFGNYSFGGTEYSGEFRNGLPEGKGIYKSQNGWTYEGTFKAGVFDADGVVTNASGEKSNVYWNEGKRVR